MKVESPKFTFSDDILIPSRTRAGDGARSDLSLPRTNKCLRRAVPSSYRTEGGSVAEDGANTPGPRIPVKAESVSMHLLKKSSTYDMAERRDSN